MALSLCLYSRQLCLRHAGFGEIREILYLYLKAEYLIYRCMTNTLCTLAYAFVPTAVCFP